MKRIISILLVMLLSISVIAGCSSSEDVQTDKDTKKEAEASIQSTDDQADDTSSAGGDDKAIYPIEGLELSYWLTLNATVAATKASIADTEYAIALEEATGVKVQYLHPAQGQEKEAFNLMIASGDLPDLIENNYFNGYPGGPVKAIEDGVILDLTDSIAMYAPNFAAYLEANPEVDKMLKTDDGKYYMFPFIRGDGKLSTYFGPIVNKALLDEYGLDLPETMDDWYEMLTTMKQSGVEVPLTYQAWMMGDGNGSPFRGAYGVAKDFYVEDGVVKWGSMEPGYKEFLMEFSKWYAEGLLDPDIASVGRDQVEEKLFAGNAGASIGYNASRLGGWIKATEGQDGFDFVGVQFPVKNAGDTVKFAQKDFPVNGLGVAVSGNIDRSKLEGTLRYLDYFYSEEGLLLNNFGLEGASYEMVDGSPVLTEAILSADDPSAVFANYARSGYSGPFIQSWDFYKQYGFKYEQQKEAIAKWSDSEALAYKMPYVTPTPEESEELASIMSQINTYRDEMYAKYLFGVETLDSYDDYVQNLIDMGIERAIEIQQGALDRYNNR